MPRIINDQTIDQELNKFAVRTFHAEAQKWIRTVAKQHIVNLDGVDRDENFRVYAPPSESIYGGIRRENDGFDTDMVSMNITLHIHHCK